MQKTTTFLMFVGKQHGKADITSNLLSSLETNVPPKNRAEEMAKARARAAQRFSGRMSF